MAHTLRRTLLNRDTRAPSLNRDTRVPSPNRDTRAPSLNTFERMHNVAPILIAQSCVKFIFISYVDYIHSSESCALRTQNQLDTRSDNANHLTASPTTTHDVHHSHVALHDDVNE